VQWSRRGEESEFLFGSWEKQIPRFARDDKECWFFGAAGEVAEKMDWYVKK